MIFLCLQRFLDFCSLLVQAMFLIKIYTSVKPWRYFQQPALNSKGDNSIQIRRAEFGGPLINLEELIFERGCTFNPLKTTRCKRKKSGGASNKVLTACRLWEKAPGI